MAIKAYTGKTTEKRTFDYEDVGIYTDTYGDTFILVEIEVGKFVPAYVGEQWIEIREPKWPLVRAGVDATVTVYGGE